MLQILFEENLSDVIVIFILRDGRTCVRSKLARTTQQLAHACAGGGTRYKSWITLNVTIRIRDGSI
ncbi:MAG: hypothetical protein CM1200mP41_15450 [Gammaproteobacteria bacterium]|nr:MAG: hypothetical protein CM1200mP41_15450 [Gammaproteobacteria bacterium]